MVYGNNLNLLAAINTNSISYTNNDETTFNFTNGTSGNFKTNIINNQINAGETGNLNINAGELILVQYKEGDEGNLSYLSSLDEGKTILNPLTEVNQTWDQTARGLNENGQAGIAVGAVALAIGTGGLGSGISGAMMTAGATTAGTIATISATNATMNADGNLIGSLDDVTKTTIKDTTSKEAIKTTAISMAVAGLGAGVGEWMKAEGVNPSLEMGSAENSKIGINVDQRIDGRWQKILPNGDVKNVSSFEAYTVGNQNPFFKTLNTTPGAPPFAGFHDVMDFPALVNQFTIAPYYAMSQCAAMPTLCAAFPDTFIKVGTWGKVDTNLDINKNTYE